MVEGRLDDRGSQFMCYKITNGRKKTERFSRGKFMLLKSIENVVPRFMFRDRKYNKLKC